MCFPGSLQHRTDMPGVEKAGFAGIEGDSWYFTQNTLSFPTSHCTFTSVSEKGFSQYLKAFKVLWQKSLLGMLGIRPQSPTAAQTPPLCLGSLAPQSYSRPGPRRGWEQGSCMASLPVCLGLCG